MTVDLLIGMLLNFHSTNPNLPVVFRNPDEGDIEISGTCLRDYNHDRESGVEVLELS